MPSEQTQSTIGSALHQNRTGTPGRALIALALALLTGLTLGQLHLLGGKLIEPSPSDSSQATRTGMEFYDAIDAYLATGEASKLRTLVQPDFVDHTAGDPATPGIEASIRQLDTLRALDAGTRLTATSVSSSGDMARFTVSIAPRPDAQVLGLPLARTALSEASETLRIADGRVAERWSDRQSSVATTSLASLVWDPPAASQMLPAIERITMLSGSTLTLKLGTAHVIIVERGALTIEGTSRGASYSDPEFPADVTDAGPIVALPGSIVLAIDSSPYRITNEGSGAAGALLIRVAGHALSTHDPVIGAFGTSRNDVGVQIETLSAAIALPHHKGVWTIVIGRATLAAGTTIPPHEVDGSELIYVEQGTLETDLGTCASRCVQTIEGVGAFASDRGRLQVGLGISASDGATTAYHIAGSTFARLLIVTVMPARG